MVKLLFFRFRITNSGLKKEKNSLPVTNSMVIHLQNAQESKVSFVNKGIV